jgi:hypothetical protein
MRMALAITMRGFAYSGVITLNVTPRPLAQPGGYLSIPEADTVVEKSTLVQNMQNLPPSCCDHCGS